MRKYIFVGVFFIALVGCTSSPNYSGKSIKGCFDPIAAVREFSLLPYCQVSSSSSVNFHGNMGIWPAFDSVASDDCFSGGVEWKNGTHFRIGGFLSFSAFESDLDSISIAVVDSSGAVRAFCRSIAMCGKGDCDLGKVKY